MGYAHIEARGPAQPLTGACCETLLPPFLGPPLHALLSKTCFSGRFPDIMLQHTGTQATNFKWVAADLLADEQGPTAEEAVSTVTAGEDFLTPSYVVPAERSVSSDQTEPITSEVDILNEIFGTSSVVPEKKEPVFASVQRTFSPSTGVQRTDKPLLSPLPEMKLGSLDEIQIPPRKPPFSKTSYADQSLAYVEGGITGTFNIPREVRITFYSGQSSLSAQALKWVHAFALRVVRDPRLLAEIRISEQQWKVQEKRLSMILQILKEEGVSAHQIRIYKTERNPDSVLMGYVYNSDQTVLKTGTKIREEEQKLIDW